MRSFVHNVEEEVSIAKVFVVSKTRDDEADTNGFAINIECCDVFLTDLIKEEIEKITALTLSYAPELQVYRHIKDKDPILEFKASQFFAGSYKVSIVNSFEEHMLKKQNYRNSINIISKSIIERIVYLFSAFSLDSY